MEPTQIEQDDIAYIVKDIIKDKLGLEESQLQDSVSLQDDLGVDSLDTVEMLMEITKTFNIRITDEETEKLKTVGSIIRLVQRKI